MIRRFTETLLLAVTAAALAACSTPPATSSSLADSGYRPRYLPASEVMTAKGTLGHFAGASYTCGDRDCQTAVRAD